MHGSLAGHAGICNGNPDFLNTVIAGDKSWLLGYDPELKVKSSQWKHLWSSKQNKQGRCVSKSVMLTMLFDSREVVNHGYTPNCKMIMKGY